jgi:transglutaminase-like putative cysteine protease
MLALLLGLTLAALDDPAASWWDDRVEASIARRPDRRDAWAAMLRDVPEDQRPGMAYLVEHLPERDLRSLDPDALRTNVDLAYRARAEVPWGPSLPEAVFLDAVLPHAVATEPRDPMRAEFHDRYLPLVRDCKTPGEAALKINEHLFKDYKVSYNTRRLRTDQNARESIAQGMATCTGLSIMLAEACRAVGVPARIAGIHSWPGRGGNHTWTEVWSDGWHFVGAAEPDPAGLDHAWFVGDAARAIASEREHAIWATRYRPTGEFAALVWARGETVPSENVTERYTKGRAPAPDRLMVEVRRGGERVEADVQVLALASADRCLVGRSLGPTADINQHLNAPVAPGTEVLVVAKQGGRAATRVAKVEGDTLVRIDLDDPEPPPAALAAILADRFGDDDAKRDAARTLLASVPFDAESRRQAWEAYKSSPEHESLRKEFDDKTVTTPDRTSPYLWREVGEKPENGWALVIAMHGGGGAPKQVNDSQWHGMFERYYKDHPETGGYIYLALRAPNDEWNGFYDDAICPLVERLIRQFVLFEGVDPDRVYTLGASHGGYGAFVIGPKIPDRFAAVHASASAPTPGETRGENLRNTPFSFMVGEKDTAYGRADRCQEFAKQVEAWRDQYGGFPTTFEWKPGVGHSVPDRDKVAELLASPPRDVRPKHLVWFPTDNVLARQFWLEAPEPADGAHVEAVADGNTIRLKPEGLKSVALWLDSDLVDLDKPVTIEVEGGDSETVTPEPSLETYCLGLEKWGDPKLAAPVRIPVELTR